MATLGCLATLPKMATKVSMLPLSVRAWCTAFLPKASKVSRVLREMARLGIGQLPHPVALGAG